MAKKGGNPENPKPFKKGYDKRRANSGQSPNPIITDIKKYIREKLAEPAATGSDHTKLDAIVARIMKDAFDGRPHAQELALAYGFGKPTQMIEMEARMQI